MLLIFLFILYSFFYHDSTRCLKNDFHCPSYIEYIKYFHKNSIKYFTYFLNIKIQYLI